MQFPMTGASDRCFVFLARVRERLRKSGIRSHILGFLFKRHFQRSGIVVLRGLWPPPRIENWGRIEVGNCAFFPGAHLECWKDATIRIGTGTYLNRNTEIVAAKAVTIGRDCKIARDVIIMDTDQHPVSGDAVLADPVVIGDRVWVGARAIILKGVTIGHDAVIGAASVVTGDIPPGVIAAGVPARVLRQKDLDCNSARGIVDVPGCSTRTQPSTNGRRRQRRVSSPGNDFD